MDKVDAILTVVDHAGGDHVYNVAINTEIPKVASVGWDLSQFAEVFAPLIVHLTQAPLEVIAFTFLVNNKVLSEGVS